MRLTFIGLINKDWVVEKRGARYIENERILMMMVKNQAPWRP